MPVGFGIGIIVPIIKNECWFIISW